MGRYRGNESSRTLLDRSQRLAGTQQAPSLDASRFKFPHLLVGGTLNSSELVQEVHEGVARAGKCDEMSCERIKQDPHHEEVSAAAEPRLEAASEAAERATPC